MPTHEDDDRAWDTQLQLDRDVGQLPHCTSLGITCAMPNCSPTCVEALEQEIAELRDVLVFADGAVVVGMGHGIADLYNETTTKQGVIARAGCHPRGAHRG